ncbi:DUF333 domain-containing protein [Shewanella sp. NIFS-20-20]|uniref:putative hemolysin n=1 Tax=Shewanella sp. NIFS-20-20 TaxID=2853806 RepID=UPI001C48290A|nr:DUF333 domain-containing protein [Shewanella sp. NIFS-20-20]MBV7317335.1 DUF333 domain-containing protein [Shewanella sp. NIFS-20-20]
MIHSRLIVLLGLSSLLLNGCAPTQAPPPAQTMGLANPAAVFCVNQGGQYIIDNQNGSSMGYCLYQGETHEAWQWYRQHHSSHDTNPQDNQ